MGKENAEPVLRCKSFRAEAIRVRSIENISEIMGSYPNAKQTEYGAVLKYKIGVGRNRFSVAELSGSEITQTFFRGAEEATVRSVELLEFLSLLAHLSGCYEVKMASIYPEITFALAGAALILEDRPRIGLSEGERERMLQLSMSNSFLSQSSIGLRARLSKAEDDLVTYREFCSILLERMVPGGMESATYPSIRSALERLGMKGSACDRLAQLCSCDTTGKHSKA